MKFELQTPLKWCFVTQPFGVNWASFYKDLGLAGHNGIDMRADRSTEVYAAHDAKVLWAGEYAGYGINVFLEAEEFFDDVKYQTIYAHLQEVKVKKDQIIKAGDLIGLSDNTGKYTLAEHLHFGLYAVDKNGNRLNSSNGVNGALDPAPFFADRGWNLLPVGKRYGRFYDPSDPGKRPWHAYLSEKKVLVPLIRYLRTFPTHEQINAVVYGAHTRETIANPAMYPLWATLTKAEMDAGKKPPIRVGI